MTLIRDYFKFLNNKFMSNQIWSNDQITWTDIINPAKEELNSFSKQHHINHHVLADCLEPNHLPKKEQLKNISFIILRVYDKKVSKYPSSIQEMSNKIAIFYDNKQIITIHRNPVSLVKEIKTKYFDAGIIKEISEIVTKIMWYVIQSYEDASIKLSEDIDIMEKQVFLEKQSNITLEELYYLKNSCRLNKKLMNLTKDVVYQHCSTEADASALQDVKDYIQKLIHSFEETYEDSSNLSKTYLSIVSKKTNDAIKLLTIFSVFFMPLTFIVGIYGMNFKYMPELGWKAGYPLILGIMLAISIVIFIWFKKKKIM